MIWKDFIFHQKNNLGNLKNLERSGKIFFFKVQKGLETFSFLKSFSHISSNFWKYFLFKILNLIFFQIIFIINFHLRYSMFFMSLLLINLTILTYVVLS